MPSEEEEIIKLIAQELQAGKSPNTVITELVQAGLPKNEAVTVVNAVSQQIASRGGGGGGMRQGPGPVPQRSHMSYYLWLLVAIAVLVYIAVM